MKAKRKTKKKEIKTEIESETVRRQRRSKAILYNLEHHPRMSYRIDLLSSVEKKIAFPNRKRRKELL